MRRQTAASQKLNASSLNPDISFEENRQHYDTMRHRSCDFLFDGGRSPEGRAKQSDFLS